MAIPTGNGLGDRVRDHGQERSLTSTPSPAACCWSTPIARTRPDEILWDYDQENPLADARGFQVDGEKYTPNQQENIARNKTLINGARYYVDHAHPEYSCPEVTNARDLVIHEKAGERDHRDQPTRGELGLLPEGAADGGPQEQQRRQGQQLRMPRELLDGPSDVLQADRRAPDAVLRDPPDLHCGAGKVGSENRGPIPATSSSPSDRTSSRPRLRSTPWSSGRSSTPGTNPTQTARSTAACT